MVLFDHSFHARVQDVQISLLGQLQECYEKEYQKETASHVDMPPTLDDLADLRCYRSFHYEVG